MELKVSSIMPSPMVSEKDAGITRERKLVSLTIMSRKTRCQHAKEWDWALPHPVCESYKTLHFSANAVQHLERKQGSMYVLRLSPGLHEDKGLKPLPTNEDGSME